MKTKFTPAYVLEMLKEIKTLCDQNKFNSIQFSKVYSSYLTFGKILESKGIFSNKTGKPTWISVEPNLVMAKAVLRIYLENKKQNAENKKMDSVTKEEYKIDSNKIPYIESLEKENSELKLKLQDLKEKISDVIKVSKKETEIKDKKISELELIIAEVKKAHASLVKQLGEIQNHQFFDRGNLTENNTYLNKLTNDLRNANIKLKIELNNKNSIINGLKNELRIKCDLLEEQVSSVPKEDITLNKKIYEQKQKIINLEKALIEKDSMIKEFKSISIVKSPNVTKKIRIFGIPIYTLETK